MTVAPSAPAKPDVDPFTVDYSHWPLEHFQDLFVVSHTFSTSDPSLWCPLLTAAARSEALRAHSVQYLNCGGRDHNVKTCRSPFINTTGVLNPALGRLDDGSYAFQQWQQRMLLYRRGQYERNVERNSRRHAKRHSNQRGHPSGNSNSRSYHSSSISNNSRSNNQRGQHSRKNSGTHQLTPPSPQRLPANTTASTALTIPNSATSTSSTSNSAHMRYGPFHNTGNKDNNNARQPITFRTN